MTDPKRRPSRALRGPQGGASGHVACLLILLAFSLYVFRLDSPPIPIFDEGLFYIPAAKAYLAGQPDPNFEHPPLSKLSIAAGIAVLGDNPWGWRVPSALAGTLGIALTYRLSRRLWASEIAGLLAAWLLITDFLWLEGSRLALLDIFSAVLLLVALNLALSRKTSAAGFFLGLAAAAKWSALWGAAGVLLALLPPHPGGRENGNSAGSGPALVAPRPHGESLPRARQMAFLVLAAAIGYSLPWLYNLIVLGETPLDVVDRHLRMLSYGAQAGAEGASTLDLLLAPAWWLLNGPLVVTAREDRSFWIVMMSNPFVFWGGLVALALLARRRAAGVLVITALALYLPWFLVPRIKYFYYLTPVIPLLAVAIPGAWLLRIPRSWRVAYLTGAVAAFVGAYPVLTGSLPR